MHSVISGLKAPSMMNSAIIIETRQRIPMTMHINVIAIINLLKNILIEVQHGLFKFSKNNNGVMTVSASTA